MGERNLGQIYFLTQVPWHNEQSVAVPASYVEQALEVIQHIRAYYSPTFENLDKRSKLRIIFEALLLGWVIPAGNKKT